jgi:hypothetical protein
MSSTSEPVGWTDPLPDFSQAPIRQRVKIGGHDFRIAVSAVKQEVPFEPNTHLVQVAAFLDDEPLTAWDLGIRAPEACANVWGYLTNRLTETVVQFYAPRPRDTGELNPRLGCWGPRPDLAAEGMVDTDCSIAVVLGMSIWMPGASPPVDEGVFLGALRDTLVEALTYWVVVAERGARPENRRN